MIAGAFRLASWGAQLVVVVLAAGLEFGTGCTCEGAGQYETVAGDPRCRICARPVSPY